MASFGMGLDSSVMLLRWLEEPETRDFDLSELTVVTAITGDEFESTRRLVERHILPRLAEHRVRFIQCGRSARTTTVNGGGVVVFDDSTDPRRLHFRGSYTLSAEMLAAGTIPQLGGARTCSVHAKGWALDPVIAALTRGGHYRHAIGFEVNEHRRAAKDALFNTDRRHGWYPLLDWVFDRQRCHDYAVAALGESIEKSACGYCPFSMSTEAGRRALMRRYGAEPERAVQALVLEDVARRLNPRQTLISGSSLADVVASAGLPAVIDTFREQLDGMAWSLYEVRRVTPIASSGRRGVTARSIRALDRGSRAEMEAALSGHPGQTVTDTAGIVRQHLDCPERCEHLLVAAPAVVMDKQRSQFEHFWKEAHRGHDTLF
ncbi:hypothetical protein AWC04_02560 [Mycolicibacterium fallax]|uniref:Phosphoadenosine phosphosulfate reductase n=1 Tax=Mycolicibacterium fallax TaxID=1793 RepID=A0A1X1RKC2_MYCFA|nr:hypothetical protein AWC04_02560 [Mycolicibacterium fallax]